MHGITMIKVEGASIDMSDIDPTSSYDRLEERRITKIFFDEKEYDVVVSVRNRNSGILSREGLIYGFNVEFLGVHRIPELDGKEVSEMVEYLNNSWPTKLL